MKHGPKPKLTPADDALIEPPSVPKWLPKYAAAEWNRVVPGLIARRVLTETDLGALESYCLAIAQIRDCQDTLAKEGLFSETASGTKRPHPATSILIRQQATARQLAGELGLTPTSRQRAGQGTAQHEQADDWAGLAD